MGPAAEYNRRLARWQLRIADLDRRHLWLSNTRLLLAGAGAVLLWQAVIRHTVSGAWPLAAAFPKGKAEREAQIDASVKAIDFAALGRAVGLHGVTVRTRSDLSAVADWLATGDPPGMVLDAKVVPTVVADWLEEAFRGH